jgi:large subunit ribosomal protein L10
LKGGVVNVKLEQKQKIVEELNDKFKKSKVLIITDYKGLNVTTLNELRRKLRESDIEYRVVKNTLLARAADDTDVSKIKDSFKGPSAIAISYEDPVAPAKVLTKFAEENKKLEIKIGVMGDRVLNLNDIKALSSLPSREVLLGHVLSAMMAVPTGLVSALSNIPRKMINVIQAIKEQKEAA